jgi:hypothetical protein
MSKIKRIIGWNEYLSNTENIILLGLMFTSILLLLILILVIIYCYVVGIDIPHSSDIVIWW